MVDLANASGVCVHAFLLVSNDGIVPPAGLPELVENIRVLVGPDVCSDDRISPEVADATERRSAPTSLVVLNHFLVTHVQGGGNEVGSDNVEASTAFGEVVEGRVPTRNRVGCLVGHRMTVKRQSENR